MLNEWWESHLGEVLFCGIYAIFSAIINLVDWGWWYENNKEDVDIDMFINK